MLALLLALACPAPADPAAEPAATEPVAEAPKRPPMPGTLHAPSSVDVGQPFTVRFEAPGTDGCYRQEVESVKFGDGTIYHRYRTWSEGEMCAMAMVEGGFSHEVTLAKPGTWTGLVERDGKVVSRYTVTASPRQSLPKK